MTWQHGFYSSLDYVFPLAEPLSEEEQGKPVKRLEEQKATLPQREEILSEYLAACQSLLDKEDGRKQGIETRLTSILGLSSIAGTVGAAGLFLGTGGGSRIQSRSVRGLVALVGCYLILQICAAMLAAARGLSRRAYIHLGLPDLVAGPGEPRSTFLHRKAERILDALSDHELQNNNKLTQLAIAHCALRNFLCGLIAFSVIGAAVMFWAGGSDDLVDRLKKDNKLNELLRGPQGIAGPKGEPAPPGAAPTVPCAVPPKPEKGCPKLPPKPTQPDLKH